MLDLKQIDDEKHRALTGHSNRNILQFAEYLDQKQVPMWIRHVVVPGLTDSEKDLYHLGRFIGTLKYAKALDVLPYHDMGKVKYKISVSSILWKTCRRCPGKRLWEQKK